MAGKGANLERVTYLWFSIVAPHGLDVGSVGSQ